VFGRLRPGKPASPAKARGSQASTPFSSSSTTAPPTHALTASAEDADNLFDWLSNSEEVYFDVGSEQVIFDTKGVG